MNRPCLHLFGAGALFAVLAPTAMARTMVPEARYTTTANTVFDSKTKLIWQRDRANAQLYDWSGAKDYCTSAEMATILGGAGRLPTMKELMTIVDYSRFAPAIDPDAFPATPTSPFWSSSLLVFTQSTQAWTVTFLDGRNASSGVTSRLSVRCVR